MGRSPCCSKVGLNRGGWTAAEDKILRDYIKVHGAGRWRNLPKSAGLKRCGKSCRLRWLNYLRPDIKRGNISHDEEELIIRLHKLLGNRWSLIAGRLPGRTDNEIKNYWNTTLVKRVHDHHNSEPTCKCPIQSDKNNKKKTRMASQGPAKMESQHKNKSEVIRTKAVRCSKKVVISTPQPNKIEPVDSNTRPGQLDHVKDSSIANPNQSGSCNGASSFTPEEDHNPSNFMLDIDMGDICLLDLLKSDFSGLCDFDYINGNNNYNALTPSSDGPLIFSEEMLETWTIADNFVD